MLNPGVKKFEFLVDIVRQTLTMAAMFSMEVQLNGDALETLDALAKQVDMPREELISQVLEEMLPLLRRRHLLKFGGNTALSSEDSDAPTTMGLLGECHTEILKCVPSFNPSQNDV